MGDPFDVDYVAHEMGHQFGGNRTFNGTIGSCAGGNRNAATAYEPGSGSTIQAYAGICGADDLQPNSDPYFHTISFDEIVAYSTVGLGNACPVTTNTGNTPPVPNAGTGGFTIPANTPFALTGSATDANGDPLTYNWEEFDLGAAGPPGNPSNPPFFRSWLATTSPTRTFPRISNLVNNTLPIGEVLPNVTGTLRFRLTARDNRAGGGGVDYSLLTFNVTTAAGPFQVTVPNSLHSPTLTWPALNTQTVTWNVANTTAAPVSYPNVSIQLSTDGGLTYPTTILASTPNDGSEAVTVPNSQTTTARIKVVCVNNVFFDISNVNFTISPPLAVNLASFAAEAQANQIHVTWETVSEVNNAGFNLYRADDAAGPQTLLSYVPSQGPGSAQGFAYSYDDLAVQPGQTYWYLLEDVSMSGATDAARAGQCNDERADGGDARITASHTGRFDCRAGAGRTRGPGRSGRRRVE